MERESWRKEELQGEESQNFLQETKQDHLHWEKQSHAQAQRQKDLNGESLWVATSWCFLGATHLQAALTYQQAMAFLTAWTLGCSALPGFSQPSADRGCYCREKAPSGIPSLKMTGRTFWQVGGAGNRFLHYIGRKPVLLQIPTHTFEKNKTQESGIFPAV